MKVSNRLERKPRMSRRKGSKYAGYFNWLYDNYLPTLKDTYYKSMANEDFDTAIDSLNDIKKLGKKLSRTRFKRKAREVKKWLEQVESE